MDFNYLSKEEVKLVVLVCRLCINVTDVSYPLSYLKILLNDVLPELDLSLTKDPVACMNCVEIISNSFNFKKMCMGRQRIIRDYYEKTHTAVNLYTLKETQQDYDTISNVPQNNFKYRCKISSEIPVKNSIGKIDTPQTCDSTSNIVKSTNNIIDINKAEQEQKILLENEHIKTLTLKSTDKISRSNNDTKKLSCVEENTNPVRIEETLTDNSEVIEIVESDINSDVELGGPDNEDILFREFCCKSETKIENYDGYGNDEGLKSIESIKDEDCIQIVDHHIESDDSEDDSDMTFTEEFNRDNKISEENTDLKPVTSAIVRVTKEENASLFSNKFLGSGNILSVLSRKTSKQYKKKNRGKLHERIERALFLCVICRKPFTQKLHVDGHLLNKHRDIPDIEKKVDSKIHYCHYCPYRTVNNYNLAKHLASIHNLRNSGYRRKFERFFCAHCEYSTENKGNLIIHVRTHNLVKAFQCYLCEQAYNQKAILDKHIIRNHT